MADAGRDVGANRTVALVRESFLAPTTAGILSLTGLHSCPLVWKRNPAIVRAR